MFLQYNEWVQIDAARTLARPRERSRLVVQPTADDDVGPGSRFAFCCSANCDRVFALANNLSRAFGLHTTSSQHLKHSHIHKITTQSIIRIQASGLHYLQPPPQYCQYLRHRILIGSLDWAIYSANNTSPYIHTALTTRIWQPHQYT